MSEGSQPGVQFRPMTPADVQAVLEIIRQVDEDDYDNARYTYRDSLAGHYVLLYEGRVIGVTGARFAEETDGSWWLSWTYLDAPYRGSGLGAAMLEQMLGELQRLNCRKVFVTTSDYIDEDEGEVYRDAMQAYQRAGFVEELRHPDYYQRNEGQITLGLQLEPLQSAPQPPPDETPARFTELGPIPETEGAYFLDWHFSPERAATVDDLLAVVRRAEGKRARMVFVAAPSDAVGVIRVLTTAGFRQEGQLRNYYQDGLDELHFRYDLV